jgi:hypothetical protein
MQEFKGWKMQAERGEKQDKVVEPEKKDTKRLIEEQG